MTALDFIRQKMTEKFDKREQFLSKKDLEIKSQGLGFGKSQLNTIRKQLTIVGYLKEWEPGIYRAIKSIPSNFNTHQLRKEYDAILKLRRISKK